MVSLRRSMPAQQGSRGTAQVHPQPFGQAHASAASIPAAGHSTAQPFSAAAAMMQLTGQLADCAGLIAACLL